MTYILCEPQAVEPQTARLLESPDPHTAARVERIATTARASSLRLQVAAYMASLGVLDNALTQT